MKRTILMGLLSLIVPIAAQAQRFSLSTDIMDYLNFGTLNLEGSAAVARHVSIHAEAQYNPWTFNSRDASRQIQNRHQTYALGVRWWPWNVYSGWWMAAAAQYQEYNSGGILSKRTQEGDAYGMSLSAGWSMMLTPYMNLDFGLGFWGGRKHYTDFACPRCGKITGQGRTWFLMPNELMIALMFTF